MMPIARALLPALVAGTLFSGCATPVGPVEVTRFHLPDTTVLGRGAIRVEPAPGDDGSSIEFRTYAAAVAQELTRLGYSEALPGGPAGSQVALLHVERETLAPVRRGGPVSVGVGGGTGSYGSGLGVGLGINLSGPPPEQVETRLSLVIRDRVGGQNLWEGRARFAVRANAPLAQTSLGAAKMAQALFRGFPGESGETIVVP
ncbi:DUF4136 domain-containing protein [Novosphingobium sp. 9U]|uniref:DUF4136 domain-containing protein n=1 Tax=Novosphingobium sp. 9U TaxID=2653158 RepID=UPI0012F2C839|nr:DUF4136 domain-containing protein [Novosphingobium sp. 9U]VWX52943.1 conserved exported hypothetical protein [Novosphingobium sp. 9U]